MEKNQSKPKYRRGMKRKITQSKLDNELAKALKRGDTELVREEIEEGANVNIDDMESQRTQSELDKDLLAAVKGGDAELVKKEIDKGANANVSDTEWPHDASLHLSSRNGHIDIVKALIGANADINIKNVDHNTALHLSLWRGHIDIAKVLIKANADVNINNAVGDTALHFSSKNGKIYTVKALVEAHADVNISNAAGDTALHLSLRHGEVGIAKALIKANADVNIKNGNDDTALHVSSKYGHTDCVKALIKANADVNIKNEDRDTALHLSSGNGHIDIVKALIEANADTNIKNRDYNTSLHLSLMSGHIDIAKALIKANAAVNIINKSHDTALHLLIQNGCIDIAHALIEAKANVNIKNRAGDTALHLSLNEGHIDLAKAVIEADADVNIKNKAKWDTALPLSSRHGHTDIVKALLLAKADVNIQNRTDGDTALHLSSRNGHTDIVKALLLAKADVNIQNRTDGDTALHLSSRNGHTEIAKALIVANADVSIQNQADETALHLSSRNCHTDITEVLIEASADVNIRGMDNNTCLHLSSLKGDTHIVQKLLERGADPNLRNDQEVLPVILAALNGHTEAIGELFNGGAKIDITDPSEISLTQRILMESAPTMLEVVISDELYGNAPGENDRTILHLAACLGCHEHTKRLLAMAGIHLNPKDRLGKTPLHCACEIGNTETITDLLRAGCELRALDNTKKSVLHIASIYGHCGLLKLFISKGLDPYQVDKSERNCLHYAVLYRNEDVARELFNTADKSKYNTLDSHRKMPRQYLCDCERSSLISRLIHDDASWIEEIPLEEYHTFCPDISECLHVSEIPNEPYIGSVNAIKEHDMNSFIVFVEEEVEQIIHSALPNSYTVEVIGVGSSFEGTKNGLPNELDFIIKLFHVGLSSSGQEGYMKMERNEEMVKRLNIIGSYGMWLWEKLVAYWTKCEIKGKTTRKYLNRQFAMSLPPQRHPDHKTCTTWIWLYSDAMFKELPVSIDFVPALETDISETKSISTWAMTEHEMREKKCQIVPKIPHGNSSLSTNFSVDDINQLGRVSYPALEVEHLENLDSRIKNVYITAKCLRKPEVCGFKITKEKGEVKAASEFVTSYRLKSVFLHLVELFLNSKLSLGKMVLMVYEQLEKCLERGNLPMFFDPEVNVLAGSKLKTAESLTVTRMMTRFVRALYERDYSSEMEEDSYVEAKAIEKERTARSSFDKKMRIYETKMKEWNNDRRDWWKKPERPVKPTKPVLLHPYIRENLQLVILARGRMPTKMSSAQKNKD